MTGCPNVEVRKKAYLYANGQVIAQYDGETSANKYFYLHDRLGSVRQLIKAGTGNDAVAVVKMYTYDQFGNTLDEQTASGETVVNNFKFAGQMIDTETNQYYMRARNYQPIMGRFTSRDPLSGSFQEPTT